MAARDRRSSSTVSKTAAPPDASNGILRAGQGILQCDGYAAYRKLAEPNRPGGPATLACCCWAHLRREFYKLHDAGVSQTATWTIARMADLWAVESQVRGYDPQTRLDARRHTSAPIVAELQARWESELTRISGKSKLAEAIRYGLSRKAEFRRFLEDGRVELDNKISPATDGARWTLTVFAQACGLKHFQKPLCRHIA